jgi:penicillin-binding protein 2
VQKYTRYKDYQPSCLHYHGAIDVATALSKSCNYFFFEMGYLLNINRLNSYCKQFGLGNTTGVEAGLKESVGNLSSPEYKQSVFNLPWNPGDTIQTAIGQLYNSFTPLQLSQYTATLANGGTRYNQHLIKSVMTYDMSSTVKDDFSQVLNKVDISQSTYDSVRQGMLRVTEDGTSSAVFDNYALKVCGKTGTADAANGKTNAVFIAFAPYDNPEIAISIVLENGGYGNNAAVIAKDIFDFYFFNEGESYVDTPINTPLG